MNNLIRALGLNIEGRRRNKRRNRRIISDSNETRIYTHTHTLTHSHTHLRMEVELEVDPLNGISIVSFFVWIVGKRNEIVEDADAGCWMLDAGCWRIFSNSLRKDCADRAKVGEADSSASSWTVPAC